LVRLLEAGHFLQIFHSEGLIDMRILVKAVACIVFSQVVQAGVLPEIARVPDDLKITRGRSTAEFDFEQCKLALPLDRGDLVGFSERFGDAFYYRPKWVEDRRIFPYLYKPDVEHYSDMVWQYVKPQRVSEIWFGLNCVQGDLNSSGAPLVEVNCPAIWVGGHWRLREGLNLVYDQRGLFPIKGDGWVGYGLIVKSRKAARIQLKFCGSNGTQTFIGQSYWGQSYPKLLGGVKSKLLELRFVDAKDMSHESK
jgi:hypothetical protein